MEQDGKTRIGRYDVPVRFAKYPSIVDFHSGEHGRFERGYYCFWTAVLNIGRKKITGRARIILPPGERFTRIGMEARKCESKEDRRAYSNLWKIMGRGKNVLYVRPSSLKEISRWIKFHQSDAKHINSIHMGGKQIGTTTKRHA